jgi:hypothetical protein
MTFPGGNDLIFLPTHSTYKISTAYAYIVFDVMPSNDTLAVASINGVVANTLNVTLTSDQTVVSITVVPISFDCATNAQTYTFTVDLGLIFA